MPNSAISMGRYFSGRPCNKTLDIRGNFAKNPDRLHFAPFVWEVIAGRLMLNFAPITRGS